MIVQSSKGADDLTPVWDAFTALCRVTDDLTPFEHQHIDVGFGQSPRTRRTGRTCADDDDRPVLHVRHAITWSSNRSHPACRSSGQQQDQSHLAQRVGRTLEVQTNENST